MAEYYWVMTAVGLAKRAEAEAGGIAIDMRTGYFAVGDGNGAYYDPDPDQTALVHERWRGALNRVYVNPSDNTLMVCEALIPLDVGGWDIREAGIIDAAGDLIAVGKYPLITKPDPSSGAARAEYVRGGFRISNGGDTVLQIDDSLVMATQEALDNHASWTNPHGCTSTAIAGRLILRDASGRKGCVNTPVDPEHIARKDTVDAHVNLFNPHGSTSAGTANRLILRDANGRAKISAPVESDDIANRGFVTYSNLPDKPDFTRMINEVIFVVGSYYVNHDDSRNPQLILGFGTWVAVQRFVLGVSAIYTANTFGGETAHTLTTQEMPSHSHLIAGDDRENVAGVMTVVGTADTGSAGTGGGNIYNTGQTGGGAAHNNMPPYETAYIWRRTA